MLIITSEHPSFKYKSERKFQDNISQSCQIYEQPKEELIYFKGEKHMDQSKFSSEHIKNKMVTITSKTLSSEDCFETKLQANFDKSDQNFEQTEE